SKSDKSAEKSPGKGKPKQPEPDLEKGQPEQPEELSNQEKRKAF
ncbi:9135_t:CDS:1, partial [Dentiscutata erythropus]